MADVPSLSPADSDLSVRVASASLHPKQCCLQNQHLPRPAGRDSSKSASRDSECSASRATSYQPAGRIRGRRRPTLAELPLLSSQVPLFAASFMQHYSAQRDKSPERRSHTCSPHRKQRRANHRVSMSDSNIEVRRVCRCVPRSQQQSSVSFRKTARRYNVVVKIKDRCQPSKQNAQHSQTLRRSHSTLITLQVFHCQI